MSTVIKILPQYLANRIAAGEVIGRPEAVVKELMENSIDAGAKDILLRIKDAGKTYIQVSDNAAGMGYEDALLCMQRHSTSKISVPEDLECIKTLGFRGEALASVCAVSQVELRTKTQSDELGTFVRNHGSEVMECSKVQTETGTSVTVKNLFYNTPARRNFLKSDQTEFRHIYDTFIRLAVSYPGISFHFVNNDEEIFNLAETDLKGRLKQIYGEEYSGSLIEVDSAFPMVKVHGFISLPEFSKRNKQDQYLYLNNRYVMSKSLSYAVHLAYGDLIEKGDYPNFFIFLFLDPRRFDVNVHPSKLEVKFDDERTVFNFIRKSVRETLDKNDLTVGAKLESESSGISRSYRSFAGADDGKYEPVTSRGFEFKRSIAPNIHELFSSRKTAASPVTDDLMPDVANGSADEIKKENVDRLIGKQALWQFQNKYIMYQLDKSLMIIDQHAAHERILYEQTLERLNSNAGLSQQLLIPVYVELNQVDYDLAKSLSSELKTLGFNLEFLSKRKIKIVGIPSDVRIGDEEKIVQDLLDEYKANEVKFDLDKRDNLAKSYACKHAIRTGDNLTNEEMLNLIDKLFAAEMPYVCPHGRPAIIKISIEELDKKFERT